MKLGWKCAKKECTAHYWVYILHGSLRVLFSFWPTYRPNWIKISDRLLPFKRGTAPKSVSFFISTALVILFKFFSRRLGSILRSKKFAAARSSSICKTSILYWREYELAGGLMVFIGQPWIIIQTDVIEMFTHKEDRLALRKTSIVGFVFQPTVNDGLAMLRLAYSLIEFFIFGIKRSIGADANTDGRISFRSDSDDTRLVSLLIIFATLWRCVSLWQSFPSV